MVGGTTAAAAPLPKTLNDVAAEVVVVEVAGPVVLLGGPWLKARLAAGLRVDSEADVAVVLPNWKMGAAVAVPDAVVLGNEPNRKGWAVETVVVVEMAAAVLLLVGAARVLSPKLNTGLLTVAGVVLTTADEEAGGVAPTAPSNPEKPEVLEVGWLLGIWWADTS